MRMRLFYSDALTLNSGQANPLLLAGNRVEIKPWLVAGHNLFGLSLNNARQAESATRFCQRSQVRSQFC